jgi:hypothetical protein
MRVHIPTPEEIFVQLVHGDEDRRPLLFISTSIITVVATIAVVLRFISARLNGSILRADDYTIFLALVMTAHLFPVALSYLPSQPSLTEIRRF